MLLRWEIDPQAPGVPFISALPTPVPTPYGVTFQNVDPTDILPNA